MQALWLENNQLSFRSDVPLPEPQAHEARVRVLRAGVCNTDLELLRGYYPYTGVIGHEFVGVVDRGPEHLIDRRVVGEINAACGTCQYCLADLPTHCENRTVLGIVNHNGAFADYLCLPIENLHVVPDNVSDEAATFVEPIAAALQIQQQVTIGKKHRVLVIGDGKLGQLIAMTLALTGAELLAVGRHPEKLANLSDRGITTGFSQDIAPHSFDIAVECTGNPEGFALALKALKPRGKLVLKSTYAGQLNIDAALIVVNEITLVGSRCGPFVPALDLLSEGAIDPSPLIEACYELGDGLQAFAHAQRKGTQKILIAP